MKKFLTTIFLLSSFISYSQTYDTDFNVRWNHIEKRIIELESKQINTDFRLNKFKNKTLKSRYLGLGGLCLTGISTGLFLSQNSDKNVASVFGIGGLVMMISGFVVNLESIKEFDMEDKDYDILPVERVLNNKPRPNVILED